MNKPLKPLLIKRGPQFSGAISMIGLIIALFSLVFGLDFYFNEEYDSFGYAFLAFFIGLGTLLDIRGVVIDFQNNRIMEYRSFWGYKHGKWEQLEQFKRIILTHERVSFRSYGNTRNTSTSFCLVLKGNKGDNVLPFELVEYANHKAGRQKLIELATALNIPFYDVFHEKTLISEKGKMENEVKRFFKRH